MEKLIQITADGIQIVVPWAWRGPVLLAAALAAIILSARMIPPVGRFFASLGLPETTRAELRLDTLPKALTRPLVALWAALFLALAFGILWDLAKLVLDVTGGADLTHGTPDSTKEARADHRWTLLTLTALTAAISAVIALPFTIIRIGHSRRQTRTAEENLTTDLINKAVEGLGAEKTVRQNGEERTVPNLEVRIGAIYQLERIARIQAQSGTEQGAADHIRIMKILCAYIRENTGPPVDLNLGPWPAQEEPQSDEQSEQLQARILERNKLREKRLEALARDHAPRTDILTALEVLGRRNETQFQIERKDTRPGQELGYRLDLHGANLQAAALGHLDFRMANFGKASMDGVVLNSARLNGAIFRLAKMTGAILRKAYLDNADLRGVQLEGADLREAYLVGANLSPASLDRRDID
ncbi:MAG: pentapeptide repeat-containing protein [Rhodobacteraceae bacterium]|nr:pentapeptide repeat-containing protein [Paracoccaceae bacterium]